LHLFFRCHRFFHASEIVGRKIVIHGGWDGTEVFNDLWIFNTDSFVWMQPRSAGFGPTPRYGHTMTLTVDGRLLVIGGCTIVEETGVPKYNDDIRQLDTDTMVWTRPRVNGHIPTGRYGHSSTLLSDGRIAIFGGWGRGGCQTREMIDDVKAYSVEVLDTKSMTWYIPKRTNHKQVKHLYNHGCCRGSASSIFMFGGFDGRQALSDFYVVNFDYESNY
jgi:host cell factor